MALRNISYCLRYSNKERLFRNRYSFASSISHFSCINATTNIRKKELIPSKRIINNNFLIFNYNYPLTCIYRPLSINGPNTSSDLNPLKGETKLPPLEPEKLAKVIQEVQTSKLKAVNNSANNTTVKTTESSDSEKKETKTVAKLSLKDKIKHELLHYYHGFRLFLLETKVTIGILWSILRGHTVTRRERKQLVRTVSDLFRLVPFVVFIVVPFMEFLLPLYIKFFPFMMPSTFKEKSKEAEKTHQLLKGKLEIAKFLQDTLDETKNSGKYKSDGNISLETFNHFMKQARESGNTASTDDILKFSRLFEDEVTLESLDHKQVKALCKLLDINSIGPKALLSFHLRMRVHQLNVDDKMIMLEGISKIPTYELQQLCRERGMRSIGVSEERLRYQLKQWLKLSIENQVPISLLLLSRTMYLPESLSAEEQLSKTILILPELVSKEASLLTSSATAKFDNKTMFEVIKEEEMAIRVEKEAAETKRIEKETLIDKAPIISLSKDDSEVSKKKKLEEESISPSDLEQLETAIESIAGAQTSIQEEELEELKEQAADLTESITSLKGANKVSKKLQSMIKEMDKLLEKLDVEQEALKKTVSDEVHPKKEEEERIIAIGDLLKTLRQMKSVSHDEEKWRRILEMFDDDHDGHIEIHHLTELKELVDGEEFKLTSKDVERVLDSIDKKDVIEDEEDGRKDGVVKGEDGEKRQ